MTVKKKKNIFIIFLFALLAVTAAFWAASPFIFEKQKAAAGIVHSSAKNSIDSNFIKAVTTNQDTAVKIIRVSKYEDLKVPYTIDEQAGRRIRRIFDGRRINIAVIGVDSRLGSAYKHADANHILSIIIDKGIIEITSIPRDTPADAGYEENDTLDLNRLTNVYPRKGKEAYFKEAAMIAGLDRIHYYVELGFSQAMGILELLGYRQSSETLQVLRSRNVLGGDDFQRTYNQGQFIRQAILNHFGKMTGFFRGLMLRGGLALVKTNLSYDKAAYIIDRLEKNNLTADPDNITVRVRPAIPIKFKKFNFCDASTMQAIINKLNAFSAKKTTNQLDSGKAASAETILWKAVNKASADSSKSPRRVIHTLKTYFDQRAWLQVKNQHERNKIRSEFYFLLRNAYLKNGNLKMAEHVKEVIETEKKLFSGSAFIRSASGSGESSTTSYGE